MANENGITGRLAVWTGLVGTAPPNRPRDLFGGTGRPNPTPGAGWRLLGQGDTEITEEGLEIMGEQTIERVRKHNSTMVQKFLRTEETQGFSCSVQDVTAETLRYLLNGNTVHEVDPSTGLTGRRRIGLTQGTAVTEYACILGISASPYDATPAEANPLRGMAYYPAGAFTGNFSTAVVKGNVMMLPLSFEAREYTGAIPSLGIPAGQAAMGFIEWEDDDAG